MKNLAKKGLITLLILLGLQIAAVAEPFTTSEAPASSAAVVGYFLLLVAFIVAPAFKKSRTASN